MRRWTMNRRRFFIFAITVSSILIFGGVSLAQQEWSADISGVPDVQWLWGEAVSVDAAKGELVVKFLDYETEEEKQVVIVVDDKTAFENVNSLAQIKVADILSVDYVVEKGGKNLAKNINVEKPEEIDAPEINVPIEPALESLPEETMDAGQTSEESAPEISEEPVEVPPVKE
jgi:hypothetical protein